MSRMTELRDTIVTELSAFYEDCHMDNPTREAALFVDSLIAAARKEGAEQERERIRGGSQMVGVEKYGVNFVGGVDYVGSAFLVPVNVMDPPASVLAPKEVKR